MASEDAGDDLPAAVSDYLTSIHMGDGIDDKALAVIRAGLQRRAVEWSGAETIPRADAVALLELIHGDAYPYPPDVQLQIDGVAGDLFIEVARLLYGDDSN